MSKQKISKSRFTVSSKTSPVTLTGVLSIKTILNINLELYLQSVF